MDRKSNSNTFALVSGIMFALCGMIILIQSIRYGGFDSDVGLEVFSLLGLAAALFLKKHEAVLGMALVSALSILILVIKYSLAFFTPITAYLLSYVFGIACLYFAVQKLTIKIYLVCSCCFYCTVLLSKHSNIWIFPRYPHIRGSHLNKIDAAFWHTLCLVVAQERIYYNF